MNHHSREIALLTLNSGRAFSGLVLKKLNAILRQNGKRTVELVANEEIVFSNREVKYAIKESIRNKDVYLVQLFDDPNSNQSVNDNLLSLATAINAAYFSDPYRITVVMPQFPYSRQDKKKGREPITAKIVSRFLELSGADQIFTLDIHSEAIEGFFEKVKLENLHLGKIILAHVRERLPLENLVVVAPDVGSAKRGGFFAKELRTDLAIIDKVRDYSKASTISKMRLVGEVEGRDALVCDDMISTGGTLLKGCELLKKKGVRDIHLCAPLPYLNEAAPAKFEAAYQNGLFSRLIGSNAVFWGERLKRYAWYEELDATELFARVIFNNNQGLSVSRLLS